ncbi:MAG: hypothetical protein KJ950_17055 [Proteobacteria bacterium]|nr:hypothetical protein [Pseudomonadota bacterium]MBU1685760.1 hypothetical protein [Pseudomonadota bacterium]
MHKHQRPGRFFVKNKDLTPSQRFDPSPQQGGLGKVHQLFGEELTVIIEELNEALAA